MDELAVAANVSNVVIDVTFALSTVLFPLMIWLIFRRSQTLGKYRWYILTNVSLCYIFDLWLTLIKPVFIGGPTLGWYLQGFLPASSAASRWYFVVGWLSLIHMDLSVVASLFYRYSQGRFILGSSG
ncbi:hypothetical protein AAVH_29586 [Aphelenchoides avenae]|nr:hypothetical protein AAVH_39587 [Aphelenchus avenae]KAH7703249.1 hypothetical protein AAVH_29586 [Aphelenchus avenae]